MTGEAASADPEAVHWYSVYLKKLLRKELTDLTDF